MGKRISIILMKEKGASHNRHLGRVVKAADSKSAGLCPREFEPHRCRAFVAQLAERSAVNRQVPGSIPGEGVFLFQKLFGFRFKKIQICFLKKGPTGT